MLPDKNFSITALNRKFRYEYYQDSCHTQKDWAHGLAVYKQSIYYLLESFMLVSKLLFFADGLSGASTVNDTTSLSGIRMRWHSDVIFTSIVFFSEECRFSLFLL